LQAPSLAPTVERYPRKKLLGLLNLDGGNRLLPGLDRLL